MTLPAIHRAAPAAAPLPNNIEAAVAYSFGVAAIVLLRLDARPGEYVEVADLASHLGCSVTVVRAHLETLVANGQVVAMRKNTPCDTCTSVGARCHEAECGEIESVRAC